jgi:hypothetical protein
MYGATPFAPDWLHSLMIGLFLEAFITDKCSPVAATGGRGESTATGRAYSFGVRTQ